MDPKGYEKKPWFPYLKNMYDEIGENMMAVDAKGYEEKPWWPYVLDIQKKIEEGGGGGDGMVEVLPETSFTTQVMEGFNYWEMEGLFIDSNTIKVTFDGAEYQLTAKEMDGQNLYGDLSGGTTPDYTNYPFVITSSEAVTIVYAQTAGTHTIAILGEPKAYKEATVSIYNSDFTHDDPAGIAAAHIKDGQIAAWLEVNQSEEANISVLLGASGAVLTLKTAGMKFRKESGAVTLDSTGTMATVTGECSMLIVNQ